MSKQQNSLITASEATEIIKSHFKLTNQTPQTQPEPKSVKHVQWFQSTNMKRQTLQKWFSNERTDELM